MLPSKGAADNSENPPEGQSAPAEEDLVAQLSKADPKLVLRGSWLVPQLLEVAKEVKSEKLNNLIQLFLDPETVIQSIYVTYSNCANHLKDQHPRSQPGEYQETLQPTI